MPLQHLHPQLHAHAHVREMSGCTTCTCTRAQHAGPHPCVYRCTNAVRSLGTSGHMRVASSGIKVEASRESASRYRADLGADLGGGVRAASRDGGGARQRFGFASRDGSDGSSAGFGFASRDGGGGGSGMRTSSHAPVRPTYRPIGRGRQPGATVMARWSATSDATRRQRVEREVCREGDERHGGHPACAARGHHGARRLRGDARDGDGRGRREQHGTAKQRGALGAKQLTHWARQPRLQR